MNDSEKTEWVLPSAIPFDTLKSKDLEECVYWLLDAMGAQDLTWRIGGAGDGAADQGRDLEATFYTLGADSEMEPKKWWIECKGRNGTLEKSAVQETANNSLSKSNLDYVVIVTNTTFSNPTRDWVNEWQLKYSLPKIKLWDQSHLERFLSRHPTVVLRLFSEALSLKGRLQAVESKFWNKLEFSSIKSLEDIWSGSIELQFSPMSLFALIANEFAHGNIGKRPWALQLGTKEILYVLSTSLANCGYLWMHCVKSGVEEKPIIRTFAYLVLFCLDHLKPDSLVEFILDYLNRSENDPMPQNVQEILLLPIIDQLQSELKDVCSSDCGRISCFNKTFFDYKGEDEIEHYWDRFLERPDETTQADKMSRTVIIQKNSEPCKVGFPVDAENGCPLFKLEPTISTLSECLAVFKEIAKFRKGESRESSAD